MGYQISYSITFYNAAGEVYTPNRKLLERLQTFTDNNLMENIDEILMPERPVGVTIETDFIKWHNRQQDLCDLSLDIERGYIYVVCSGEDSDMWVEVYHNNHYTSKDLSVPTLSDMVAPGVGWHSPYEPLFM